MHIGDQDDPVAVERRVQAGHGDRDPVHLWGSVGKPGARSDSSHRHSKGHDRQAAARQQSPRWINDRTSPSPHDESNWFQGQDRENQVEQKSRPGVTDPFQRRRDLTGGRHMFNASATIGVRVSKTAITVNNRRVRPGIVV